jgi:SAM-dependent methyltransferase
MSNGSQGQATVNGPRLNLGCGSNPIDGWVNLDRRPGAGVDMVFDLEQCRTIPLPFEDGSVGAFRAWHLIEHLDDVLGLMQECHRVAVPGALFRAAMPHGGHDDAWADPTHRRAMFARSFNYYQQPFHVFADYDYAGDWAPETIYYKISRKRAGADGPEELLSRVDLDRNLVREMIVDLRAVKPSRARDRSLLTAPEIKIALTD